MSDFETVARPYSKAIFELAEEQKALDIWSDVLALASTVAADGSMQALAVAPSVMSTELAEVFIAVMSAVDGGPKLTDEVNNLIRLLAENERLMALPEIAAGYEVLKQQAEGKIEVTVKSARKLTVKQRNDIAAKMKRRLGKEVTVTSHIDKSLIAGAIIYAGDLVIDGSVRGQLDKLTSQLNK